MTEDQLWLAQNPPTAFYFLMPVEKVDDLPQNPNPWDAVWVREKDDLYIFAFEEWQTAVDVVAREDRTLALGEQWARG